MTEPRITSDVHYDLSLGWVARISRVDDIGGRRTYTRVLASRWGANRYAKRWQRKLERLDREGILR